MPGNMWGNWEQWEYVKLLHHNQNVRVYTAEHEQIGSAIFIRYYLHLEFDLNLIRYWKGNHFYKYTLTRVCWHTEAIVII